MTSAPRIAALGACLFAGLCLLAHVLGPATSTETRYVESGREMLASGDWVIPTLNGAPLLEKPPLHYWVTAAAIAALGVNDVAPHVGSLLTGALLLFVVAAIGRRFAPPTDAPEAARARGRLTALALLTMPTFLVQTYVVAPDIQLVLTTTLAGWALLEADRATGRARLLWTLAMWASFGLSMLVKGPLALVLVGGAAVVTAIGRGRAGILRPFANPLGILVFAAISVPWYLAADAHLPGLLGTLVKTRLLGSMQQAAKGVGHPNPLYVTWLPLIGTAPWLATLPASIRALRARGPLRHGLSLPLIALALAAPVLFSITPNRLFSYASPALPWVAVLCVAGAPVGEASPAGAAWRRSLAHGAIGCAVAALAVPVAVYVSSDSIAVAMIVTLVLLALAAAVIGATLVRPRGRDPTPRAVVIVVCLVAAMGVAAASNPFAIPANKGLWEAVAARRTAGEELGMSLPDTGDWGLFPWYAREYVRYFAYFPTTHLVVQPGDYRPDLFVNLPKTADGPLDYTALRTWFASPQRRWLYLREKERPAILEKAESYVVARGGKYVVVTNRPLPETR